MMAPKFEIDESGMSISATTSVGDHLPELGAEMPTQMAVGEHDMPFRDAPSESSPERLEILSSVARLKESYCPLGLGRKTNFGTVKLLRCMI